ncbi:hypothetical protein N7490_001944 [Penicillium lividum]|nr:hypothetical protein N7490_001944 [Penicillium lividum]
MSRTILSASVKGFVHRDKPLIVLKPEFSEWLAKIIAIAKPAKCRIRRRRDSSGEAILLNMILAPDTAIWTLCVTDLFQAFYRARKDVGMQQATHSEIRFIQARVVHIDMTSRNEMGFKLTPETIRGLIDFYDNIPYHLRSSSSNRSHNNDPKRAFVQKVTDFVFCTSISALQSLTKDGSGVLFGHEEMTARQAVDLLLISEIAPQPQGSLSRGCQLLVQERGQMNVFNGHSSLEPWSFEEALPGRTIPYHHLAHLAYADPSFPPGATWEGFPPSPGEEQQFLPMYDQFPPRRMLLQWPSMIAKDTWDWDEINDPGRYYMSG